VGSNSSTAHPDLLGSCAAPKTYLEIVMDLRITHYATANVVAGANNGALSMDRTIHFLAESPVAQERLYREIISVDAGRNEKRKAKAPSPRPRSPRAGTKNALPRSHRTLTVPNVRMVVEQPRAHPLVGRYDPACPTGVQLPPGTVVATNGPSIRKRTDVFGADTGEYNLLR